MERDPQELQFLTVPEIVKESVSIPRSSSKIFSLITLTLVFPLSFAILFHSLFTHPILQQIQSPETNPHRYHHEYLLFLLYQLLYLLFLFAFSLLSTAAVVFTVASIYTSKPISFSSTLSAVPRILYRLFITYLWISLLMVTYNLIFIAVVFAFLVTISTTNAAAFLLLFFVVFILFLFAHVYITALWHLASVVSVLEPVYGLAAMRKSRELLRGKAVSAGVIVFLYLCICGIIGGVFGEVVVRGGDSFGVWTRILVGGFCVGVLVVVNLVGLLVQSVFYYVCKSYHHQGIDKSALYDHLGGYLGEYVPLKSSIQMENLEM